MTCFATRLRPKSAARLLLTLLVLAAVACSRDEPDAAWPDAAVLVARSDSLRRVLGDLTQLAGTPIARSAAASMARLPDCEIVQARAPSERPGDLFDAISCRETPGDLDVVDRARGARDLLIAVPDAEGSRIQIAADVGEERIELTLDWPAAPMRGALSLLLPGDAPAGPGELSPERRLAHMRVRPAGGLDLAGLVPAESQADRLFGLRSELFAGLALDGTWEAAIYLPEAGHAVPRSALALGIGVRSIALLAIERFVDRIASTWSVRRSDFALAGADGACLLDMNVLPELAPCYVATERALVIGWNAASVGTALAGREVDPPRTPNAAGVAELDLALVAQADGMLREQLASEEAAGIVSWPWQRLVAHGDRADGALRIEIALDRSAVR